MQYNIPMPINIRVGRKELRRLSSLGLLILVILIIAALATS